MEVSGSYKKAECAETLVITKVTLLLCHTVSYLVQVSYVPEASETVPIDSPNPVRSSLNCQLIHLFIASSLTIRIVYKSMQIFKNLCCLHVINFRFSSLL